MSLDVILRDACLGYDQQDGPERRDRARAALATLDGADESFLLACVLGRSRSVGERLAAAPKLATTVGGPQAWPPLLYVCYSRVEACREGESHLETARVLLDAGADPNSHWMWGDTYRFTALTGCFGEGEGGPRAQPEHREMAALASLLLARGADPNDGQALYNRMFSDGCTCLRTLVAAGLSPTDRINWLAGDAAVRTTMSYQLHQAARSGQLDRIELLLGAGVHLDELDGDGHDAAHSATVGGHADAAAMLERAGLSLPMLDDADRFCAALRAGDLSLARSLASSLDDARARHGDLFGDMVGRGAIDAVKLLLELGVDVDGTAHTPSPHQAAYHGKLEMLKLLIDGGADPHRHDQRFDADALGWARHAGQEETARFLEALFAAAPSDTDPSDTDPSKPVASDS
jgi:Ankyrin repeats (many copies)/Ankyrin repeat